MNTRSLLISAGVGGLTMSLLSVMPLVSMLNCVLCLWVWVGGIGAVFIYTRLEPERLPGDRGAAIGAIAGVVAAAVFAGLTLALGSVGVLSTMFDPSQMGEALSVAAFQGAYALIVFAVSLIVFPGIGALAGLIGAELFGKPRPMGLG